MLKMQPIICDTNVWYYLAENQDLYQEVREFPLSPNFLNLVEICHRRISDDSLKKTQRILRKIFEFENFGFFCAPLVHVAQLNGNKIDAPPGPGMVECAKALVNISKFAKADYLKFNEFVDGERKSMVDINVIFENMSLELRSKIVDGISMPEGLAIDSVRNFLSNMVVQVADGVCMTEFDWDKLELFLNTLALFDKMRIYESEKSVRKYQPNHWNDLFQLVYVQPGFLIWTEDDVWKEFITKAGFSHYMFQTNYSIKTRDYKRLRGVKSLSEAKYSG